LDTPDTILRMIDVLREAVDRVAASGCGSPQHEVGLLLAGVLGTNGATPDLDSDVALTPEQTAALEEYVRRREQHEPVAYILGRAEFHGIELEVDERVLIPRKETELVVDVALDLPQGASVHEVGTGCGAISLALLTARPDLRVTASDISEEAAEVARANAGRLGLPLEVTVAAGLPQAVRDEGRDMVLANLPYLTSETMTTRPKDLAFEPDVALHEGSGDDGLGVIRAVLAEIPAGWRVAFEHDTHHGPTVREMLRDATTHEDYMGGERVTVGTAP
jgi:release factor glutamine methyltransferase